MIKNWLKSVLKSIPSYRRWLLKRFDIEVEPKIKARIDEYLSLAENPMFHVIEIETLNRCNSTCSFCPVNKNDDPREFKKMDEALFFKIIEELSILNYSNRVALFSNNEPLLDKRIYDWLPKVREMLPNAFLLMYSNGTLLDIEKFEKLIPYLDQLFIDNYTDTHSLHDNVKEVLEHWQKHPKEGHQFEVSIRKLTETLTTRGGEAPNKVDIPSLRSSCLLPFEQMVVRPDGKVSLCCADALGKITLGDLSEQTIEEVWQSQKIKTYRKLIAEGRDKISICKSCDVFYGELQWPAWKPN
jgi:radical SAM protein with 4Fe4S-binding SPASM domain